MINMNKKILNKKFFSYLYIFLPITLITGPFLPDLSVVIIGLYFIFNLKRYKNDQLFVKKFHCIFTAFYFFSIISPLNSEYYLYSLKPSITYLRFGVFAFAVYFILIDNQKAILSLSNLFLLILTILLLDSFFQFIFGHNILGWKFGNEYRVTSFFGDDEILGSYIARLFPVMLSIFLFSKDKLNFKFNNYLFIYVFISSALIIVVSGERTALALFIISIFVMLLTCKKIRKLIFYSFVIILISITTLIVSSEKTKKRMFSQTINQLGLTSKNDRLVLFSKTYESHYALALKMFKQKPIIGYGPKTFRKFCSEPENYINDVACSTHPHNILFQLLAETGLVGFSFYLTIFFYLLFKLINIGISSFFIKNQLLAGKEYLTLVYIFYFINLFPLAPSGNFFNNWLSIVYYFPLGYMFFLQNYNLKNT